ncbi:Signal transduction histidine kinase [Dyadobacter soli]|uniref:histidine kinase n=1 Tax=Dyadobacter soli TaxID=659014 RepID=A0A1G7SJF3_9BACT|nr:HAMP domain-containing sensor histidine kinase [Dyadobacter soli]SDG23022.1 Signal transduction histidine kinase [Dyadobacter soli]
MYSTRRSITRQVKAILSVCLLFLTHTVISQQKHPTQHFTTANGLPHNSVNDLSVDSKGFVWLATEGGLTRFDGRNFLVIEKSHTGTGTNRVSAISPGLRNARNPSQLDVAYVSFATGARANIIDGHVRPVGDEVQLRDEKIHSLRARQYYDFINGLPERWGRTIRPGQSTMVAGNFGDGEFYLCSPTTVAYYRGWEKRYQLLNKTTDRLSYITLGGRLYYLNPDRSFTQIYDNQRSSFPMKGDITRNEHYAKSTAPVKLFWNNKTAQAFFYIDSQVFELVQEPDGTLTTQLLVADFNLDSESVDIIYHDRSNGEVFLASGKNGLFMMGEAGGERPGVSSAQVPSLPDGDFVVEKVVAGDKTIEPDSDTIRLSKSDNFKVYLSAPHFGDRGNLQMTYALAEPDQEYSTLEWQKIKEDRGDITIHYASVPSGLHKLIIRRHAGTGTSTYTSREMILVAPRAWYEDRWLLGLASVFALAVVLLIWRTRYVQIAQRNRWLEMQVSARTDELRQTLLTLEASRADLLQQYQLQSRLLTSMAHDLRSPLSSAVLVTGEVGRLIGRQETEKAAQLNGHLEDAIRLIKQSTDELLTYMKVQVYRTEVKMEEVALAGIIDKSFHLYAKSGRVNANAFRNHVPKNVTVSTNPQLLDIIIRNLTDNANKYTENGTITADWYRDDDSTSLSIRDTGAGLPAAIVEWFRHDESLPAPDNFNGLGLVIVKELAPFAMIRLSIQNEDDGTKVTLTFTNAKPFDLKNSNGLPASHLVENG